jgi:cytochrome c oxidase accessory protein FixG
MSVIDISSVEDHERFRAELASIRPDGRRRWIYARKPNGRYTNLRKIVSILLLMFLMAAPYVKVDGHQFMLMNIIERKFVFFGKPFWPSDFYLVAVLFLTTIVTFVVATASIGRVWCGWFCPQTVFMEMVFRRIEWFIEGTPVEQAKRHAGPWNADRIGRTVIKVLVFFGLSFVIANTFLSYIISSDVLLRDIMDGPMAHLELFVGLVFFTGVFFAVFYRFREQACLIACPYGRYMSALVDEKTVTVSYDHVRGEKRAKWTRDDVAAQKAAASGGSQIKRPESKGDCLDCHQCVTVCPTGIDIRNGIQLECVACTACIDACDEVMDKVGLDRGLIRYASLGSIRNGQPPTFLTRRVMAYAVVWLILLGAVVTLFAMRSPLDVVILRQEGTTWVKTPLGMANFYQIRLINKTYQTMPVEIRVVEPAGMSLRPLAVPTKLDAEQIVKARFILTMNEESMKHSAPTAGTPSSSQKVVLEVRTADDVQTITTSFVGP